MNDARYDRKGDIVSGRDAGTAYIFARYGAAGLFIREYGRTIIDFLAGFARPWHAAIAACLFLLVWKGAMHQQTELRHHIIDTQSCSQGPVIGMAYKIEVPSHIAKACPANGPLTWSARMGNQKFVYVSYVSKTKYAIWSAIRPFCGWIGLLAIWFAFMLWRRDQHIETNVAHFGADSEEARKAAEIPLPISLQTQPDDWLANPAQAPGGPRRSQRPVFGRKSAL